MPTYESLAALGLAQRKIQDCLAAPADLVDAWLEAIKHPPAGIKNPLGWMLAGVKSGDRPPDRRAVDGERKRLAEVRAESWVRNVGYLEDERAVVETLTDVERGMLRDYPDAAVLGRLVELWRELRPAGERVEAEALERSRRFVEARARAEAPADVDGFGAEAPAAA